MHDKDPLFLADPQHHSDSRLLNARFPYLVRVDGQRHTFHLLAYFGTPLGVQKAQGRIRAMTPKVAGVAE